MPDFADLDLDDYLHRANADEPEPEAPPMPRRRPARGQLALDLHGPRCGCRDCNPDDAAERRQELLEDRR